MEENDNLGGKGKSLMKLKSLGFNVPEFFILTPEWIKEFQLGNNIQELNEILKSLGGLISVRSSPMISMPGLMETTLNVPNNAELVSEIINDVVKSYDSKNAALYRRIHNLDDKKPAVILQRMVSGTKDNDSGAGVWFSRDNFGMSSINTYEFKKLSTGDSVVNNVYSFDDFDTLQEKYINELYLVSTVLEKELKAPVEIEFTIESGKLWILQFRELKISDQIANCNVALDLLSPSEIDNKILEIFKPGPARRVNPSSIPFHVGIGISPGIAQGIVGDDILFSEKISNDLLQQLFCSVGVITKEGGKTAHIAIQCRNFNLPYIILPTFDENLIGKHVLIDGSSGNLYLDADLIEINEKNYLDYV